MSGGGAGRGAGVEKGGEANCAGKGRRQAVYMMAANEGGTGDDDKGRGGVEKAAVVKGGGANGGVKGRRGEQPTAAKGEGEQKRRGRQR